MRMGRGKGSTMSNIIACVVSPNTVRVIKYIRLRWATHAARMGKGRSAFKIVTCNLTYCS